MMYATPSPSFITHTSLNNFCCCCFFGFVVVVQTSSAPCVSLSPNLGVSVVCLSPSTSYVTPRCLLFELQVPNPEHQKYLLIDPMQFENYSNNADGPLDLRKRKTAHFLQTIHASQVGVCVCVSVCQCLCVCIANARQSACMLYVWYAPYVCVFSGL
jgi:hypothetical protein